MINRVCSKLPVLRKLPILLLVLLAAGCEIQDEQSPSATSSQSGSSIQSSPRVAFVIGFRKGNELAQRLSKPMLLFFTADWCDYCHQMAAEAFRDKHVIALSESFVCVVVDADREKDICQRFRVKAYPTVQFVSPGGVPLNRLIGKQKQARLIVQMQAALDAVAQRNEAIPPLRR